jgi:outer membrane protein
MKWPREHPHIEVSRFVMTALLFAISVPCVHGAAQQNKGFEPVQPESGRRLALVIGNAAYPWKPLVNPINDATDVAAALSRVGFNNGHVLPVTNLNEREMKRAVREFVESIRPGDFAFVYYSGHGVEVRGSNYLLPIDIPADATEGEVEDEAVPAQRIARDLDSQGAAVKVLVLDACRDNPLRATRSTGGGLVPMEGLGSLVIFATEAGHTASDNTEGRNGLFTQYLLKALNMRGIPLDDAVRDVARQMAADTNRRQIPAIYGLLESPVILINGPVIVNSPSAEPAPDPALEAWSLIKDSRKAQDFDDFANAYPNSPYATPARMAANKLRREAAAPPEPSPNIIAQGSNNRPLEPESERKPAPEPPVRASVPSPLVATARPAKIAVAAFQAAVAQTGEFQHDAAELQKKYDPRRLQIKSLSDEIDNLTKQLQTQSAQLSDAERQSRTRVIDEKKKQLDRDTKDAQSDFEADMQQIMNDLAQKVGTLTTDYAQKHGYTMVLDAGGQQTQTVLYAVASTDITKDLVDDYNLKSGFPASPAAQKPATAGIPAPPAKAAVITFQLAVAQTGEGQRDFADLQKQYAPKEAALKALSDEIDTLTKQLQSQGAQLSDAERANRARTIDEKKKQLDRDSEDARNDFQQAMQNVYNGLASKVYDVMQSYAEQQGFTLVLDVSQQQSPVLYSVTSTNITKPVIDAYNLKSGIPTAPAAQKPASIATPAPPANAAVIAFQTAVAQTSEGQRAFADLQKKYEPKRQQLKILSDEIDNLTKQLQTQGAQLSDAERADRARNIDEKKKQLDRDSEDARNDFQQAMQNVYNGLAAKFYDVMQASAEQQGFTLVLDISQQQTPVLYSVSSSNITQEVIDAYNTKSP